MTNVREWYLERGHTMSPRNGREGFTLGEIRYGVPDSKRMAYSVEDEDRHLEEGNGKLHDGNAIPTGRFRLSLCPHSNTIKVHDVPGFHGIEVSKYGGEERLFGHVAVGDTRLLDGVGACGAAFLRLIDELRWQTNHGADVYLNVTRK